MGATEKSRNAENFAERLQIAMSDAEKSQAELARMLDTAWSTVDRWMKGSIPRRKMIEQIADALCVASRWLETGDGPKKPDPQMEATLAAGLKRAVSRIQLTDARAEQTVEEISVRLCQMPHDSPEARARRLKECHTRLDEYAEWLDNVVPAS